MEIVVGVTGATVTIYAVKLLEALKGADNVIINVLTINPEWRKFSLRVFYIARK
ncbi:hypothetical protein [Clostridium thailandense]|uniref:hypothetical protein n=1 Tax=Clostridium thailandense TaxID=2794346 RepID=UPI001FE83A7D|nr:hypothetical protein [Clostridium thailandense]